MIAGMQGAQREVNRLRTVQLKLLDPDVAAVLERVARSNFKRALIVGVVIGFICGAGGVVLARVLFKLLGWI